MKEISQIDIQDRQDLQSLRDSAINLSKCCINQNWINAYEALARAADILDAMEARSSAPQSNGRALTIGLNAGFAKDAECVAPECRCDHTSGCCGNQNEK